MIIRIEEKSGFCYGVVRAVEMADSMLDKGESLYSLGQIVHNEEEVLRLEKKGLVTISHEDLPALHNCKLLIRAHGEPPSTYEIAKRNRIELIDGTCPIVSKIQVAIAQKAKEPDAIIVIFGKLDHPEVEGLFGQSPKNTYVIGSIEEIKELPESSNVHLYSQTTMDSKAFQNLIEVLEKKQTDEHGRLLVHNTICGHVSHRRPGLQKFASENDLIIFVGGKNSSNGKVLYQVCRDVNPRTYYVGSPDELVKHWFEGAKTVGVAGATSTPRWQIDTITDKIREIDSL